MNTVQKGKMMNKFKKNDRVTIVSQGDIAARVVGFYKHTGAVKVETDAGHEWIIKPEHLRKMTEK